MHRYPYVHNTVHAAFFDPLDTVSGSAKNICAIIVLVYNHLNTIWVAYLPSSRHFRSLRLPDLLYRHPPRQTRLAPVSSPSLAGKWFISLNVHYNVDVHEFSAASAIRSLPHVVLLFAHYRLSACAYSISSKMISLSVTTYTSSKSCVAFIDSKVRAITDLPPKSCINLPGNLVAAYLAGIIAIFFIFRKSTLKFIQKYKDYLCEY